MLYASMLRIEIDEARMHIRGIWRVEGSVYRQTRKSVMERVETRLEVESDADPDLIAATLRNASSGCHAEVALREPTPIVEEVTVNGKPFDVDVYPTGPVKSRPARDG
jgi:hypothetical protein